MSAPTIHDDLTSLYAFNRWADGRLVEALRRLAPGQYLQVPAPGWTSVRATVLHAAGALNVWARRLSGETVAARPSEDDYPTLDDAERFLHNGHDAFARLLAGLDAERLSAVWTYHNYAGESASLPLWAVFRHVVNHATYHRGQVASKLRLLGFDPPVTDFLYWAIEQTPKGT